MHPKARMREEEFETQRTRMHLVIVYDGRLQIPNGHDCWFVSFIYRRKYHDFIWTSYTRTIRDLMLAGF